MPVIWNEFTELGKAARTGAPALSWSALLDYFSNHPAEARLFDEAMVGKSGAIIPAVVEAYDFKPFRMIADVGGGRGHLSKAILEQTATTTGDSCTFE